MAFDDATLRSMVERAVDLTDSAREMSEKDRDFYDGYQWTPSEIAVLKKRKQPIVTDNRIRRKVDAIVGMEQRGRVDPRAYPRNPDDEDAADVATKALVFVDDITRFDQKRSQFCFNLAIEGYGGVEVVTRTRKGLVDPDIVWLRWEEIIADPFSRNADFSDAAYLGVIKWMALDAAVAFCRQYVEDMSDEDLRDLLAQSLNEAQSGTFEDRPAGESSRSWGDKKSQRVKLAYLYYLCEGEWYLALIAGSGAIYNKPSPYLDEDGKPECAIILQSCYVDRENRRSGIVRDMISQQEEINKRRSKLLHQLNSRQVAVHSGSTKLTGNDLKRELAAPDGVIEWEQDPSTTVPGFQILNNNDQIQHQFALLEYTTNAIDNLGPNPAVLGEESSATSGRAIMAQQQAGMAELAPFFDGLRDWTLRVYRAMWNRIKQFWTEERWIRVTSEPDKLKFVGVNVPMKDPMTGQPVIDPRTGQPAIENAIAELDVDIVIDMTPEYATLQQEQFEVMADLVGKGMLQLPPEVIIRASSLRNKSELLEALNSPEMQQEQAQVKALQQRMAMLEAMVLETKAADQAASAELKKAQATAELAEIGQADPAQPQEPADPKPFLDAEAKRAQLVEQAREHDDKMQLEWFKARSDQAIKQTTAAADIRLKGDQQALARENAATDSKVKAAQAAKLRRPDPKPVNPSRRRG